MTEQLIAMFELTVADDEVKIVDEKHYQLVTADQIPPDLLRSYRNR